MNEYDKQAQEFLNKTNTVLLVDFLEHRKYFFDDKESRDVYNITLQRGERKYTFTFGQSLQESRFRLVNKNTGKEVKYIWSDEAEQYAQRDIQKYKQFVKSKIHTLGCFNIEGTHKEPTAYDVLACLTKYDPGDFENFCSEYGYNSDSRSAEVIYRGVLDEWKNIQILYSDEEIELLQEIN